MFLRQAAWTRESPTAAGLPLTASYRHATGMQVVRRRARTALVRPHLARVGYEPTDDCRRIRHVERLWHKIYRILIYFVGSSSRSLDQRLDIALWDIRQGARQPVLSCSARRTAIACAYASRLCLRRRPRRRTRSRARDQGFTAFKLAGASGEGSPGRTWLAPRAKSGRRRGRVMIDGLASLRRRR